MTQTRSRTLYSHLKSTLKFHTNQLIRGLIDTTRWALILKFTTSPSSKTPVAFTKEVYRAILTGRTTIHNITLGARFKRNSAKEKLQRQTITKVRYFAGSNKLASIEASFKIKELPKKFSNVSKFSVSLDFPDISVFLFFFFLSSKLDPCKMKMQQNFKTLITFIYPFISAALTHLVQTTRTNQTPPSYLKNRKK